MSKLIILAAAGLGLTLAHVALNAASAQTGAQIATSGTYDQTETKGKDKKKGGPKGSTKGSYSGE